MSHHKIVVGAQEECALPDLGIKKLQVKVDTGAKTSALHVDNLIYDDGKGEQWVNFDIHPDVHDVKRTIHCRTLVHDARIVKSSNGTSERRFVIRTPMKLGDDCWEIELTLTDRSEMKYPMLLGREGMGKHIMVDPARKYLLRKSRHR